MPDWTSEVPAAMDRLRRGEIGPQEALAVADGAMAYRAELLGRQEKNRTSGYADEISEIAYAVNELRDMVRSSDTAPVVCIFRRPARYLKAPKVGGRLGHLLGDPRHRLPELLVVRDGQVPFIELDGRQRVRDWWVLLVDGVPHANGPKRWIMKNAQGAAMMDGNGQIPRWILLTGLAKRRELHRRRRGLSGRRYVGADVRITLRMPDGTVMPELVDRLLNYDSEVGDARPGGVR